MMMNGRPTIERLRELLEYCPATGALRWKVYRGGRTGVGSAAGWPNEHGYLIVQVDRRYIRAHHIVFALHHGRWPSHEIDHVNGVRDDNRVQNLREATRSQNLANTRARRPGLKGVKWQRQQNKWYAHIQKDGCKYYLGPFDTEALAHDAYIAAAQDLFGDFARAQ